jgi:hypothetical protein
MMNVRKILDTTAARLSQNVLPRILSIDVASQTTAAAIIRDARRDLGDNPVLVFISPCPPPPGAGKHFQPADWLHDKQYFQRRSAHHPEGDRGTPLTIQHVPDLIVGGNPGYIEQGLAIRACMPFLKPPLMIEKRRALHEKRRERRHPEIGHPIGRIGPATLVGKPFQASAQRTQEG